MVTKVTNSMLALIAVLLGVNLLVSAEVFPRATASTSITTHEVLRARLVELIAADGKVVAQLHTADDGSANLRMRDGKGEVRIKLGATSQGAGLILMNQDTEPAVSLTAAVREASLTLAKPGSPPQVFRP